MKTTEQILALYVERQRYYAPLHASMQIISSIYNDRADVPLPDMKRTERPSVPNLLAQGMDQMSLRVSSVMPSITFASTKPGQRTADRTATTASRTIEGWWQREQMKAKLTRRARHLLGYAMAPVAMRWDSKLMQPIRQVRSPLESFPNPDTLEGNCSTTDCIFVYRRSYGWLCKQGYEPFLRGLFGQDTSAVASTQVLMLEYIDGEECVLLAVATNPYGHVFGQMPNGMTAVTLERYEHGVGMCPVSVPMRITLDGAGGQFDRMVGMYQMQARLMALEIIAVEKSIFPDTALESFAGETARIVEGPYDGRTGKITVVAGGQLKELASQPGYLGMPTIDRLERNQRVSAGIPAEFGGESGSNIRTGRRGDAVLSAVIDYAVAEAQESLANALTVENLMAMKLAKHRAGDTTTTIFVGTGNAQRPVSYTPNKTFAQEEHVVAYPVTGTDLNTLTIAIGQRVGLGTMSKRTAQELDPFISNPEVEHDTIIAEGLEQALMAGLQAKAQSGELSPVVLSRVMQLVATDKMELTDAITAATEEAMADQQQGTAMQAAAPGAVQGLAAGPEGPIPGMSAMPGIAQLGDMMGQLRRPAMTIQPMRNAAQGAI